MAEEDVVAEFNRLYPFTRPKTNVVKDAEFYLRLVQIRADLDDMAIHSMLGRNNDHHTRDQNH